VNAASADALSGAGNSVESTLESIRIRLSYMRTTLDLPEPLIEEARTRLGFKSKTDTVVVALQALVRRKRIEELKTLLGSVRLDIDIAKSRRRPGSKRA
jgi:Arc/MetJ family transcription regulator